MNSIEIIVCIFICLSKALARQPDVNFESLPPISLNLFSISMFILNAFPDGNVSAFVLFENDRLERLSYGNQAFLQSLFEPLSDFIIQFRQSPTDAIRNEYTNFGFLDSQLSANGEMLLIIRRDTRTPSFPMHHLISFDALTSSQSDPTFGSSKLYIYNAIWNKNNANQGIHFYGLFQRTNSDGSQSQSITQLAANVAMNSGIEINVQPLTQLHIKAFYTTIRTVAEFKSISPVTKFDGYKANVGERIYLVAFGDYILDDTGNTTRATKPTMIKLSENVKSSANIPKNLMLLMLGTVILAIVF